MNAAVFDLLLFFPPCFELYPIYLAVKQCFFSISRKTSEN